MFKNYGKKLKKSIAIIIAIMITFSFPVSSFAFSENEGRSIESFFIETSLLKGDGSSYGTEKEANRLEGTIILIRLMGKEQEALGMASLPCKFEDVPNWAKGYVNYAYSQNISKGISETLFGVSEKMTAAQYTTLMLRVLGYDDNLGDFNWQTSVSDAEELTIIPLDMALRYNSKGKYTKKDLLETSFCFLEATDKANTQQLIEKLVLENVVPISTAQKYGLEVESFDTISTSYYEAENFTFETDKNQLYMSGKSLDPEKKWLILQISDFNTGLDKLDKAVSADANGRYQVDMALSGLSNGLYYLDVYGNDERYDYYTSYILSSLIIEVANGESKIKAPVVYGKNLRNHNGNQVSELDTKMTAQTRAKAENVEKITALANEITAGITNDYEKIKAIHDWVAEEIYYDKDFLKGKTKSTNISSISVLESKVAVCSGYANLFNDLVSALGIPNRQVVGYALGITGEKSWDGVDPMVDANHVWNQVYIDNRWIIVDTTWDSSNEYEGGKITKEGPASDLYFDSGLEFFSATHKIMNP